MWKFLKYGFLAWVPLSVVTAPLYWPYLRMIWVFNARVAPPDYDEPSSELEARRQDLDYLSTLTDYDRSFSDDARAGFSAALEALDARIDGLSEAGFYLAIAEAVALADNGHTNISYRPQYARFGTIGARLYEFEDGLYVVSAVSDEDHTVGRKVVRINGQPIEEARAALRRFRGGNEQWRDLYSTLILESPELFAAATGAGETTSVTLELESETGDREEVTFDAIAPADGFDPPSRSAWQTLVPGALPTGDAAWSHALEAEGAVLPRYLTAPDQALSYTMPSGGLYIRALPGFAVGGQSIAQAYREMLADHAEGILDYLVVDFRLHDGGDYTKSMAFAKAAPRIVKPDGTVYILTGPNTFSAAVVTVAMLKYYSGDRAVLVGEPMGDRERFWAERGSVFRLPNSGYAINYATGLHDWETGCNGEPFCFTMNEMHEVPAGSLLPDILKRQSFESYRQGEDVVIEWIEDRH